MMHTQIRKQRRFGEAIFGASAALLMIAVIAAGSPASAGDVDRGGDPALAAGRPHCDGGAGSPALTDSDGCVRIRGYIAADDYSASDGLVGGSVPHFGPLGAHGIVANVRASGGARDKAPPSADRFFTPEGQGDLAR
jgi:hypothetical protein